MFAYEILEAGRDDLLQV